MPDSSPHPYEWGEQVEAIVIGNLQLVAWLVRGAPGPWWSCWRWN